jgi:hypothetical protein
MKRYIPTAVALCFVLSGCGSKSSGDDNATEKKDPKKVTNNQATNPATSSSTTDQTPPALVIARVADQQVNAEGQDAFKQVEFRTVKSNADVTTADKTVAQFDKGTKVSMETSEDLEGASLTTARRYWHFPILRAIGRGAVRVASWLVGYRPGYYYNNSWNYYDYNRSYNHGGYSYYTYYSYKGANGNCHNPGQNPGQSRTQHYPNQGKNGYYLQNNGNLQDSYYGQDSNGRSIYVDQYGRKYFLNSNGSKNYNVGTVNNNTTMTNNTVYTDSNGRRYQINNSGQKVYLDNQDTNNNNSRIYTDSNGRRYQLDNQGNKIYLDQNQNNNSQCG